LALHSGPTCGQRSIIPLDVNRATVSIIIPIRNEAESIRATLDSVLHQSFPSSRTEVIVVDGMSTDRTREVLDRYRQEYPRLRVVDNPARTVPAALNLSIRQATGDVIVRVDGHCRLAADYVERCVALLAESGAANVGGLMRPEGEGPIGQAMAVATRSRFGIGNGRFHYLERQAYVDTVYLGAFRTEVLHELGGYDEELVRNQDDELNYRIRQAGFSILLSPDIVSTYTPRHSLRAIWRQYYQYGFWKVRVIEKHQGSLQARHLAPALLVSGLLTSAAAFVMSRRVWTLLPWVGYVGADLMAALLNTRRSPSQTLPVALVFPCLHLSYGMGFVVGIGRHLLKSAQRAG
jgi:succinoglycan biosynthesis protein ExoA